MVHNLNELINIFIKNYDNYNINNILNINMSNHYLEKIKEINSIFGQSQIENILSILNYIVDTYKGEKIEQIKKSHLSKCSKWCKKYNLPIYDYYV